jgi:hypothetical protein
MPLKNHIGPFVILGVVLVTSLGCGHSGVQPYAEPREVHCRDKLVVANAKISQLQNRLSELEQKNATLVAKAEPPSHPVEPEFESMETPTSEESGFWLTIQNTLTGDSKSVFYADR